MWRRKKGCTEMRYLLCEAWSVKSFDRTGLNYVSCSTFRVPIARFAAAQAVVEDALQEIYRLGKSCQLWLTKLWVTKSLYHCIFVLLFAQYVVKHVFRSDTNAIQLIFAMWYKNNWVRRLVIQKLKRDNLYRVCIKFVSIYFHWLLTIYILFPSLIQRYKPNVQNIIKLALMFYCECRISSL